MFIGEPYREVLTLDMPLDGLERTYDLWWKYKANTMAARLEGRPVPTLLHLVFVDLRDAAGIWHAGFDPVSDEDQERLIELAKERVRVDLTQLELGNEPLWLDAGKHLYLIPPRT